MLFNSLEFLLFGALIFAVYFALRSWSARTLWLLVASWAFYASWNPRFLLLLIGTTWVDYHLARRIDAALAGGPSRQRQARRLVAFSVAMNLAVLALFKYGGFLWTQLALLAPLPAPPAFLLAAPPLGISFYTFHSISYIVDTYRRLRPPATVFREFALYVAFFPQLIAGPITRWGFFGPQVQSPRTADDAAVEEGTFLIVKGLTKKVLLADPIGRFVDQVFAAPGSAAAPEIALAVYGFAFQIYFDFSGYTDIALGLARLLGFRLPENFRHPYLAANPQEFWQRWHISLSTWLRDYLYLPLGGNRLGVSRTYANLFVTMTLGGLWHGAAWTYVVWGAFHGVWLVAHRWLTGVLGAPRTPLLLRRAVTFTLVALALMIFRAPTLEVVATLARGLAAGNPMNGPFPIGVCLGIVAGFATHVIGESTDLLAAWQRAPRLAQGLVVGVVLVLVGIFSDPTQQFIYFQF